MTRGALLAGLAALAAGAGLSSCGGGNDAYDVVPRSTPPLTVPTATTGLESSTPSTASSTSGTTGVTSTPAAPTNTTPAAPTNTTPANPGGAAATPQQNPGGTQAGGGTFQDFCAQNPGAC